VTRRRGASAACCWSPSFFSPLAAPNPGNPGALFALALAVLYGVCGFIFTAIGCLLYNVVASWIGGIEVELETGGSTGGSVTSS
jgi:hypothetical protein